MSLNSQKDLALVRKKRARKMVRITQDKKEVF